MQERVVFATISKGMKAKTRYQMTPISREREASSRLMSIGKEYGSKARTMLVENPKGLAGYIHC